MARVVCDQLSTQFRQPVVVENRAGAGTAIAAAFVAKSDPDGYTVLVNSSAHTISPLLQPNPTFDPGRDFSAVIPFGNSPNVLVVSPSRGFKTVGDLLAAARAKPGSLNFASAGVGSGVHMSAERFLASAGIVAVHVPFKGSPEAISELMAGRVDFYFSPVGLVAAHIREGKLLALAVNSPKRAVILPEVPTLAEAGVADAEYPLWYGLFVPARTPRHVVETLHRETLKALKTPNVEDKLATLAGENSRPTNGENSTPAHTSCGETGRSIIAMRFFGRDLGGRRSVQLSDAHKKISVAAKPSAVRPACSAAHFSIKARLAGPALAGSVAISILFVTGRDLVLEMGTPPYRALLIRKG